MIAESLRPLVVPIDSVKQDPKNLRGHDDRNVESIMDSLRAFGQRKPIVVSKESGIITAGNGTHIAAKKLGWTEIAAVQVEETPTKATRFAIADNRTAELAQWDRAALRDALAHLKEINQFDGLGFSPEDFDSLTNMERDRPDAEKAEAEYGVILVPGITPSDRAAVLRAINKALEGTGLEADAY